jgi:hypothetical protein
MCFLWRNREQGRIQGGGGGAPGARPPKIVFLHEIPQNISRLPPLDAIFLSAPP